MMMAGTATNLCSTFRREAASAWKHMEKADRIGIALNEETITELVTLELASVYLADPRFKVALATKPEEAIHGAYWTWWFTQRGTGVQFQIQAKRLFATGRYQSLLKAPASNSKAYSQLDKLVAEATKANCEALYCFYNFNHPDGNFRSRPSNCSHKYKAPTFWGCALATAYDVRQAKSDKLAVLRTSMRPWHEFVCLRGSLTLPDAVAEFVRERTALREEVSSGVRVERRSLPDNIGRLLDLAGKRSYGPLVFDDVFKGDDGLAGIVVIDDLGP